MSGKLGDLTDEVLGEVIEQGKAIGQTAVKQITGAGTKSQLPKTPPKAGEVKSIPTPESSVKDVGFKDILPEPVPQEKVEELKQRDLLERKKGIDKTRTELGMLKIRRYQELQQKIFEKEKEAEQIPEYEAGKPGGARTVEEKIAIMEEEKKKQKEVQEDTAPVLPKSGKHMPGLDIFSKSQKGTKELGKKIMG